MFSVGRLLRARVVEGGFSASYLHIATLRYVAEKKQPLMREIAQYLHIAPPSATSLVNTLVKHGEIRRTKDKNDHRVVRLEVTAQGHKTLDNTTRRKHDLIQEVIEKLNGRERMELINVLKKIMRLSTEHQ